MTPKTNLFYIWIVLPKVELELLDNIYSHQYHLQICTNHSILNKYIKGSYKKREEKNTVWTNQGVYNQQLHKSYVTTTLGRYTSTPGIKDTYRFPT